jgi:GntR family transcriptional regulator, histidine utilization repressor
VSRAIQGRNGASRPEPLYAAIKRYVLDGITRGEFKVGDRLESEAELMKRFGVSRMTAHRALRELQAAGFLVRLPGVGTFVADTSAKGHIIEIRNIAEEVRSRGHEHSALVLLNRAEGADRRAAVQLGIAPGTPVFHSIIVHREAGVPIQHEERFVLASAAPGYDQADFTRMTPNEFLMRAAPLEKVDHIVRATLPTRKLGKLLEMQELEPCLLLVRKTWSKSKLVAYAELSHPASRYEFEDSFEVNAPA